MAAFVKKAVKQGVQKELSAKKRKAAEDGELDLNALESELKDFNYDDMNCDDMINLNLSDDDDDDISC